MGRYQHDPSVISATLVVLPKDDYEFKIGKPKAFERTASKGNQSYGIRIPMVVSSGPQAGKRVIYTIYLHSEGGASFGKQFQIAAHGLTVNEVNEKIFNEFAAGKDWSYDTDSGEIGEEWAKYEGMSVACSVDAIATTNDKGDLVTQQEWKTWMPVQGA